MITQQVKTNISIFWIFSFVVIAICRVGSVESPNHPRVNGDDKAWLFTHSTHHGVAGFCHFGQA